MHRVVVAGQQAGGVDPHLGDLRGAVPVPGVVAGQPEAEALLPLPGQPHLVEPEGVGDMVVLDAGEVPDQPGDGVGAGGGAGVQAVGVQALDGGVDFFLDAAVALDEDVLRKHVSTIAQSVLRRPPFTRPPFTCPPSPAAPSAPGPPGWSPARAAAARWSRTPSRPRP